MKHEFCLLADFSEHDQEVTLSPEEAHHALHVLRLKPQQHIIVANAAGLRAQGIIKQIQKSQIIVTITAHRYTPKPPTKTALALAALRPTSMDDIVAPLSEIGLDELLVFLGDQTQKTRLNDKCKARWIKLARQAVKQCGRPWPLTFRYYDNLKELLHENKDRFSLKIAWEANKPRFTLPESPQNLTILSVVGQEAGLSQGELKMLKDHDFQFYSLGPYLLRAQTAALVAAHTSIMADGF